MIVVETSGGLLVRRKGHTHTRNKNDKSERDQKVSRKCRTERRE